jgi:hypothetical protein
MRLVIAFLFCSVNLLGQDILFFSNNQIQAKILLIDDDIIEYKKFNNIDGPLYEVKRSSIVKIQLESGEIIKNQQNKINTINKNTIINSKRLNSEPDIYYSNGIQIMNFINNDIVLAMSMAKGRSYGQYYMAEISIFNNTGKNINFSPKENIKCSYINNGIATPADLLSYDEYINKVKSRQALSTLVLGVAEVYNASQAAYSHTNTYGTLNAYGNSQTNSSYYNTNGYFSNYSSNSNSRVNAYANINSSTYDGEAAYYAQQNAFNNISNYSQYLNIRKEKIQDEYLRKHTIRPGQEYSGRINIKYLSASLIELLIMLDGNEYSFIWDYTNIHNFND